MQTEDAYKVGMTLTEQICSAEERLTKLSHALEDRWEKKELIDYMQQKRQAIKFNHLSVRTTVQKTKSTGPRSIAADLTRFSIAQRQAVNNNDARPSNGVKRSNSTKTSSELDIDYITGLRPRSRYSEEEMRKRIPTTTCTMHSYIKPLPAQCGSVRKFTNRSPHHHNLSYHQQCVSEHTLLRLITMHIHFTGNFTDKKTSLHPDVILESIMNEEYVCIIIILLT